MLSKSIFKILAKLNKIIIPRYSKKDLSRLSKIDQALIAYRYWVTKNSLD
jgi:transcription termination factor NusB